jgi:hypothetical protein
LPARPAGREMAGKKFAFAPASDLVKAKIVFGSNTYTSIWAFSGGAGQGELRDRPLPLLQAAPIALCSSRRRPLRHPVANHTRQSGCQDGGSPIEGPQQMRLAVEQIRQRLRARRPGRKVGHAPPGIRDPARVAGASLGKAPARIARPRQKGIRTKLSRS